MCVIKIKITTINIVGTKRENVIYKHLEKKTTFMHDKAILIRARGSMRALIYTCT